MNVKRYTLVLIVLLVMVPGVYAKSPIENLEIIKDLPEEIVAGNEYEMILTFDHTSFTPLLVEVIVTCEESPLGLGEVFVKSVEFNGDGVGCIEISPGIFNLDSQLLEGESSNELRLTVSSLINLMPGTYTFDTTLITEEVVDYIEEVPAGTTTIDIEEIGVILGNFTSSEPVTVTVDVYEENPYPEAEVPPDSPMALGIFLDFETTAVEFTTQIRVYYEDEDVESLEIDESELRLYYYEAPSWVQCVPSGVNTYKNYVWADVDHFTVFAPFGAEVEEEPEPEPSPPSPGRSNKKPISDVGENRTVYVDQIVLFNGTGSRDPDGAIMSWRWTFGDGVKASGEVVTHIYSEPGNYTVTLTVKDNRGAEVSDTCSVEVRETPTPPTPPPPPPPPPLPPILSDLEITPEVELGDEAVITFNIKNMDNQSLQYIVSIQIGMITFTVEAELEDYEFRTLTHTFIPTRAGDYDVQIDGMTGEFTVVEPEEPEPPTPPTPAEFLIENFTYTSEIQEGEIFEVSVDVINVGGTAGEVIMTVEIDGEVAIMPVLYLEPGEGLSRTWGTFEDYEVGPHVVSLDGFEEVFIVTPLPTPPIWTQPIFKVVAIIVFGALIGYLYVRSRPTWPPKEFVTEPLSESEEV